MRKNRTAVFRGDQMLIKFGAENNPERETVMVTEPGPAEWAITAIPGFQKFRAGIGAGRLSRM